MGPELRLSLRLYFLLCHGFRAGLVSIVVDKKRSRRVRDET